MPGRMMDYATTESVVVVANHVLRTQWIDIDGFARSRTGEGNPGELWTGSAGGPTRDGREAVDISALGENVFAARGQKSYWGTFSQNSVQDGGGWYRR